MVKVKDHFFGLNIPLHVPSEPDELTKVNSGKSVINSGIFLLNSGKSGCISGKIALIPEFHPTIPENTTKALAPPVDLS